MRYQRNNLTDNQQSLLLNKVVGIVGLGGLGGFIFEYILRIGVKEIYIMDNDNFDYSNLNRQILSNNNNINDSKIKQAINHALKVNPDIKINTLSQYLNNDNHYFLKECDLIFDATDNIDSRLTLEKLSNNYLIPIVHGAVNKNYIQVALIKPMSNLLTKLYKDKYIQDSPKTMIYTCSICASLQVSIAIKYLLDPDYKLETILYVDLDDYSIQHLNI